MELVPPKCIECGSKPLPMMMHEVNTPSGLILGIVNCISCGHVYAVFPLGMREPVIVPPNLRN